MSMQDILDRLRESERALRAQDVAHAALFGSVARGDARPDSDIDIMVEIAPEIELDSPRSPRASIAVAAAAPWCRDLRAAGLWRRSVAICRRASRTCAAVHAMAACRGARPAPPPLVGIDVRERD